MIIKLNINTNLEIKSIKDLRKLKIIMDSNNLKVNKTQIAKELKVDVRTVSKYLNGYEKPITRNKKSKIDEYENIIKELLSSKTQIFYYRRVLYQYLVDNFNFKYPEITFRHYLKTKINYGSTFLR